MHIDRDSFFLGMYAGAVLLSAFKAIASLWSHPRKHGVRVIISGNLVRIEGGDRD